MRFKELNFAFVLISLLTLAACTGGQKRNLEIDTRSIEIEPVQIKRYEQALFAIKPDSLKAGLKAIAPQFQVFLNVDLDDTLNIIQLHQFITEPANIELFGLVSKSYPDMKVIEEGFTEAFKHFQFYFPEKELTNISTYVSGLMYELPVQFFDKHMIIALDMYLGSDIEQYRKFRFPLYKIDRMNRDYIVRDGMYDFYYYHFIKVPGENILERMISNGKHLYYLDAMMPDLPDHIKIGFPEEKLRWCFANESNIWSFMVQNELLYTSDAGSMRKFFTDGPFTTQFGQQSPARIGEWLGWQIVRSYMNNNRQVTLQELIGNNDMQLIFKKSKYKPAR
ncbi:MAG: hypothetical protein IH598_16965 [Bacteroidales bacterium]|nr:hypothetical protein [Bacteroidales bacterium]